MICFSFSIITYLLVIKIKIILANAIILKIIGIHSNFISVCFLSSWYCSWYNCWYGTKLSEKNVSKFVKRVKNSFESKYNLESFLLAKI